MLEPAYDVFAARHAADEACLVTATLIADLETPVSAFLKLSACRDGRCFLLESIEGGASRGRYSMIGLDPDVVFRAIAGRAEIARDALAAPDDFEPCAETPLVALRALIAASRVPPSEDALPPMAAGVFGYLGYDMVREMERLAPAKPDPIGVPDSMLPATDHHGRLRHGTRRDFGRDAGAPETGRGRARRLPRGRDPDRRRHRHPRRAAGTWGAEGVPGPAGRHRADSTNTPPTRFLGMVEKAKEYIRAGDIFQVVLSQRFLDALRTARLLALPSACAGSIRRRSSATSISAASRSSVRRRRSWLGCAMAR